MMKLTESSVSNLQALSLPQLLGIKHSLGKFFYQSGVNISFYSVLRKEDVSLFQAKIIKAIKKQLWDFIKLENIKNNEDMIKKKLPSFLKVYPQGYEEINSFLGLVSEDGISTAEDKLEASFKKPSLGNRTRQRTNVMVESIDKVLISWLYDLMGKGQVNRVSSLELMKYLNEKFEEIAAQKGEAIVRAEILTMLNLAEYETYLLNDVEKMSWGVAVGEESQESCSKNKLAGYVGLNSAFPSGHKFPPSGVYCSCFLLPFTVKSRIYQTVN